MSYPRLAMLVRFYSRLDLPGTTRLMKWTGVRNDALWADAPARIVVGKWDKCRRTVRLSNWSERLTFFLRRYYELPPQLMLIEALRPGDTFVDIGANVGMITTLAARLVGPTGHVTAFEPNPDCCELIAHVLRENNLSHVDLHSCALSDARGELELTVPEVHTGYGTLARVEESGEWKGSRHIAVQVRVGDEVLGESLDNLAAIKIDVEGFESNVIRGLRDTLSKWKPMLVTEVSEKLLRQAGSSAEELFALLKGHGYSAYVLHVSKPRRLSRPRLTLRAIEEHTDIASPEDNVVWLHPTGHMMSRVKELLAR